MKRFTLIPIVTLILLVGAGATVGMIAASEAPPAPADEVQAVEKLTLGPSAVPEPALSVSSDDDSPLPSRETPDIQYPTLGSALDQMVAVAEDEGSSPQEAGGDDATVQTEPVAVSIYLSGNTDDVVAFLEDNGGDPRNVGEDYIEAYVPVDLLGELSEQPGVLRVREIIPPTVN